MILEMTLERTDSHLSALGSRPFMTLPLLYLDSSLNARHNLGRL